MALTSTVGVARTGTLSLRATIPEGIVAFLELKPSDKLDWKMEIMDGERVVIVRKKNNDEGTAIAKKYVKSRK